MKKLLLFFGLGCAINLFAQQNPVTESFVKSHAYSIAFSGNEKSSDLKDVSFLFPNWEKALADHDASDLDLSLMYPQFQPTDKFQHFVISTSGYVITVLPRERVQQLYNRSLIKNKTK
jgi:hypothetical protein